MQNIFKAKTPVDPRLTDLEKLEHSIAGWERFIRLMVFPFAVLSAWLSAKGLFDARIADFASSTEGMITAAMTAVIAALMVFGANTLLFGLATQVTRKQRWKVVALTIAILPFIFGVSTYNAILATTSERAVIQGLRDRVILHEEYIAASTQDTDNAQAAEAGLLPLKESLCSLAHGEKSGGILTGGASGYGSVYAAYSSSCASVGRIIDTLSDTKSATHAQRGAFADILAQMESIPRDTSLTVFERAEQFRDADRKLYTLLQNTHSERVADRLEVQLSVLEQTVASLGTKSGSLGKKQDRAIANLKDTLSHVSDTLETLMKTDGTVMQKPKPMLTMNEAVARYWKSSLSNIMISVASDTFSIWLICFLLVSRSCLQERRDELLGTLNNVTPQDQ